VSSQKSNPIALVSELDAPFNLFLLLHNLTLFTGLTVSGKKDGFDEKRLFESKLLIEKDRRDATFVIIFESKKTIK
jgi:hypothetical protein